MGNRAEGILIERNRELINGGKEVVAGVHLLDELGVN